MLGKRLIKTSAGAACTTDTVQILDGVPFQSIATYELDGDAESSVKTGYIGNAAIFNGSSSSIATPITTNYSNLSISCWVKFNALPTGNADATLVSKGFYVSGSNTQYLHLRYEDFTDQFTFAIRQNSTYNQQAVSGVTATTGVWYHVVGTLDSSGNAQIYVNGSAGTGITSAPTMTNSDDFEIGSFATTVSLLNGSIDQVRIFNKALSSSEVTTLYGETSASSTKSTTDIFADSSGIALYEFEGNANDTSGTYNGTATNVVYNEYDGTASNVTYSTGKFGQAGVFNGSSGYIDLGSTIDDPLRTEGAFGVSFWFNANSYGSDSVIFKLLNDIYIYIFLNASNQIECRVSNSSGVQSTVTFGVSLNTWYHIVWTGNSTNGVTLYVNGSSVGNAAWDGTFFTYTNTTYKHNYLGYNGGNVGWYNGSIDQVRIYDKALSASDVTTLYNETVATASTNPTFNSPSLVAYYKMNDATDETGSYDGTPTNVNFNVAGKFGNAGEFNGSSSYISTGINFSTLPNTKSISMWIKSTGSSSVGFGGMDGSSANNGLFIFDESAGNIAYIPKFGGYHTASASTVNTNDWNHFVVTDTNVDGNVKMYINGSQVTVTKNNSTVYVNNTNMQIGRQMRNTGTAFWQTGKIDQIRIFDRAITANEVETLYNEVYCQPTIVPTDYFEPVLYTGNGGTQSISTLDFQPDLVWIKARVTAYSHRLFDSVRTLNGRLESNTTAAEVSNTVNDNFVSFNSNGFTLGATSSTNGSNFNNEPFVAWNWKAGGAAVTNTDGTITSQVSANTDAGFSIVSYAGNNGSSATIGHGLNSAPELVIIKARNLAAGWPTLGVPGGNFTYCRRLNDTAVDNPSSYYSTFFNSTLPTSSVFSVGNSDEVNDGYNYIAYCFHSVDGMSKIGSYVGVGSGNTVNVVTGFRPAMIIIKRTDSIEDWKIIDNKRDFANSLEPNEPIAEEVGNNSNFSSHSNGFTIGDPHGDYNASGGTYIYMAFAEENVEPQPVLANSFNTVTYTGNGSTQAINTVGFQPDLVWIKSRSDAYGHILNDSVRGANRFLYSNTTEAEDVRTNSDFSSFNSDGFTLGTNYVATNGLNKTFVAWCWKASNESTINQDGSITSIVSANPAAGFSVVKYTGTGVSGSYGHGLLSAPELIITKNIDWSTPDWFVYHKDLAVNGYLRLNQTTSEQSASTIWASAPSTTVVNIGNDSGVNRSTGDTQIAYCFHSVDGYQSVGSYTSDNQTTKNISVGFRPSFLLLKRTNGASNWALVDDLRGSNELYANTSGAEAPEASIPTFYDDGFTLHNTRYNGGTDTYIYLAIA